MAWKHRDALLPWVYAIILAGTAVYLCREAFLTEPTGHFASMHGVWLALARVVGLDWFGPRWWPYWGAGAPLPHVYAPLAPFSIAAIARVFGCSPAMAFHALTALVYCLAPLTLYLAAWKLTRAAGYSFLAGLVYLLGPVPHHLDPDAGFGLAWFLGARRAYRLFEWDDLPHDIPAVLLPLAAWLLARALQRRRPLDYALAGAVMACMMAASMFGMVLTAVIAVTVPLALEHKFRPTLLLRSGLTALAAYLVVSPWAPPSLLQTVRMNAVLDGEADWSWRGLLALGIIAASTLAAWRFVCPRIRSAGVRWAILFACFAVLVPALDHYAGIHFLPQPYRYQIELEIALALLIAAAVRAGAERIAPRVRAVIAIPLLLVAGHQIVEHRRFMKTMLQPADVERSIERPVPEWLETRFPGQRAVLPGSIAAWANAFTDAPQLTAQPYTTAPNWMQQVLLYVVFSGDAETSLLWMKAFGAHTVTVSGPKSPEYWKPFANPRKFEGVLEPLWAADDTTIYRIPQRTSSLAHAVAPGQIVTRRMGNAIENAEMAKYVAALDSDSGSASLTWLDPNRAAIQAQLEPGQVLSVQVNYDRGWRATVEGSPRRVRSDSLGLMVVEPDCSGPCTVLLEYDGGWEAQATRTASLTVLLVTALWVLRRRRAS